MQKTAYDMRISDWGSDVCSSDLRLTAASTPGQAWHLLERRESDGRRAEHFVDTRGEFMDAHLTPSHQFSRLKKSMRPALTLAFVVIDLESAKGLTVPQLADLIGRASCRERVCRSV